MASKATPRDRADLGAAVPATDGHRLLRAPQPSTSANGVCRKGASPMPLRQAFPPISNAARTAKARTQVSDRPFRGRQHHPVRPPPKIRAPPCRPTPTRWAPPPKCRAPP